MYLPSVSHSVSPFSQLHQLPEVLNGAAIPVSKTYNHASEMMTVKTISSFYLVGRLHHPLCWSFSFLWKKWHTVLLPWLQSWHLNLSSPLQHISNVKSKSKSVSRKWWIVNVYSLQYHMWSLGLSRWFLESSSLTSSHLLVIFFLWAYT